MSEQEKDPQQQQQEQNNKEAKKFETNWRKVVALFAGESLFKPKKIGSKDIEIALAELVKEEKEQAVKDFKEEARKLIKEKNDFDAAVKAEQQKAEKAIIEKKKDFNKKAEVLFARIDKIQNIEKQYYETLKGASEIPHEEKGVEDPSKTKEETNAGTQKDESPKK